MIPFEKVRTVLNVAPDAELRLLNDREDTANIALAEQNKKFAEIVEVFHIENIKQLIRQSAENSENDILLEFINPFPGINFNQFIELLQEAEIYKTFLEYAAQEGYEVGYMGQGQLVCVHIQWGPNTRVEDFVKQRSYTR